ncbi:MAG: 6-phosphofructokinase [Candidatus Marinimicrobia bacterium]|nr:6-phosphofructokinase [Candidatus Neomarinimicrobiota bacterium]
MAKANAVYAQSGGVTSVINGSAYGVIKAAQKSDLIENIYGGLYGINGVLEENLVDISQEDPADIERLPFTPSGAFGSCRKKLPSLEKNRADFERIIEVFKAHDVRYFFYNGGNDSMDTAHKISQLSHDMGYEVTCIGVPKTVDNDLPVTDNCPGFGSVAKYNAVSIQEASFDVASMHHDSTKVFVTETMGRHAGWIAASAALAARTENDGPHIILLPEIAFKEAEFLAEVERIRSKIGYCVVAVSEGLQNPDGKFVADAGTVDMFGHTQLGGAGDFIANLVKNKLGIKVHNALPDYFQRSGRHIASRTDVEQAIAVGKEAVRLAAEGLNGEMVTIVRDSDSPYSWSVGHTDIANIANKEKVLPPEYIREDGFHVTDAFRQYCLPLIEGELWPEYSNGIPLYTQLKRNLVPKKLG